MGKELTAFQKRCQDCTDLKIKNGQWLCDECFGCPIEEVDDCPEGVTLEAIEALEKKAKETAPKLVARDKTKGTHRTRERKPDEEKEQIIQKTAEFIGNFAENIKITNISKLIEFDIGENHYKFDLIRQRKSKN